MALRQLQTRQVTVNPVPTFRKPTTTTGLNRHALGNVSNKQQTTNIQGYKSKHLKPLQAARPVVKNVPARTKSKAGVGQGESVQNSTVSTTTSNQGTSRSEVIEEMIPPPCEPMSPKNRHSHERSVTPQPMDVSDVAGALQRKLKLEETVDDKERANPQFCSDYVQDIYHYLGELEALYHPNPKYISLQPQINHRMRAILIDWLILVQVKFNLLPETLYLSVSIIDRFLEVYPTTKDKLQLVGVTAMLIASKYEEIYFPQVQDFVYITDHSYSEDEVRGMERVMLKTIGYNLGIPASIHFLRRYSKLNQVNSRTHTMAKFFLELSLVSYSMLAFLPSQVAASALYLARKVLATDNKPCSTNISYYGDYTEKDLQPCCTQLAVIVKGMHSSKQQAVREKYSNSKFLSVAKDPILGGGIIHELAAQRKAS